MRVSIIGPVYPYRGGIAHYTTTLSQELTQAGHQVQTISFKRQYPGRLYPGQSDKDPSLLHEQVPAEYLLDPLYFWTWNKAARRISAFKPQLVIIMWWTTFWAPALIVLSIALRRRHIPLVFCIHNVIPHENRSFDRWLARSVLSKGDACITLSPKETSRLKQYLPSMVVFQSQLPVPKAAHSLIDREGVREELGIARNQHTFLFFGMIRPYKGLSVLIDALGLLAQEGVRPFLIIAGEFWEDVQKYKNQIAQNMLEGQVLIDNRYVPNEEIGKYFLAADGFVAPYLQGTQSAAIKMAMAYGLPILASVQISSDLPSSGYVILHHMGGDAADLARSIRLFMQKDFSDSPGEHNESEPLAALIEKIGQRLCEI